MSKRPRTLIRDFTIAWLCALEVEVNAARSILDEEYDDYEVTGHILGRVGKHNVVISLPPAGRIGSTTAAVTAERLKHNFPSIEYWLMVGIGGGVPSSNNDIRLGDVVISQPSGTFGGVVQYDMGKITHGGQTLQTGSLCAPPDDLLRAIVHMKSNIMFGKSRLSKRLSEVTKKFGFVRPPSHTDVLFETMYKHIDGPSCAKCDPRHIVRRTPRETDAVVIHVGLIASGNRVVKDAETRDKLSHDFGGVLCFEMEAAGLMNNFRCLVIRGICDYADDHKHKEWQPFAAAAAASCAKEILSCVTPATSSNIDSNVPPEVAEVKATAETHQPLGGDFDWSAGRLQLVPRSNKRFRSNMTLARSHVAEDDRERCFRALRFAQLETRFLSIASAYSHTCLWLMDRPEFLDWLDGSKSHLHNGLLWIKGKAATGKSTMIKCLLTHIRHENPDIVVAAFFFNARGEAVEKSVLGMYRSLLYQVLEQCPELQTVFDTGLIQLDQAGCALWDVDVLRTLFNLALAKLDNRPLLCVVDALDECSEEGFPDLTQFFDEIGAFFHDSKVSIRVLTSSRHFPHFDIQGGTRIVLEDQVEHDQDIVEYIRGKLRAGASPQAQQIRNEVASRASGIFLWVVLVVGILNDEYRRGRIHALAKKLKEVPDDVEQLFNDILQRGGHCSDETVLCLQWVLHARRPLELTELYCAVMAGIDEGPFSPWDKDAITNEDMERFVLDASKGLIEVTAGTQNYAQLIHECVREFFQSGKSLDIAPFSPASSFPARSHVSLRSCCLAYYQQALSIDGALPYRERKQVVQDFPFLGYAVQNILYHCDYAESLGVLQDEFLHSFDRTTWVVLANLLHWSSDPMYEPGCSLLLPIVDQDLTALTRKTLRRVGVLDEVYSHERLLMLTGLASIGKTEFESIAQWLKYTIEEGAEMVGLPLNVVESEQAVSKGMELLQARRHCVGLGWSDSQLIWAIHLRNPVMVGLLLVAESARATEFVHTKDFLHEAAAEGQVDIVTILLRCCRLPEHIWAQLLCEASQVSESGVSDLLLDEFEADLRGSLEPQPNYVREAFVAAAYSGHIRTVKWLLSTGFVDINSPSERFFGSTALHCAARSGHLDIVRLLLSREGIDVNCRNSQHDRPLGLAVLYGHLPIVRWLLHQESIDVNVYDKRQTTPLLMAIIDERISMVEAILDHPDTDVNLPYRGGHSLFKESAQGRTPLQIAVAIGNDEIVELLTTKKRATIDLSEAHNGGHTALAIASMNGSNDMTRGALANGFEVNAVDAEGRTALFLAMEKTSYNIFAILLKLPDIDVNLANTAGETPLIVGIRCRNDYSVRILLDHPQTQVHRMDKDGNSALSLMARSWMSHWEQTGIIHTIWRHPSCSSTLFKDQIGEAIYQELAEYEPDPEVDPESEWYDLTQAADELNVK